MVEGRDTPTSCVQNTVGKITVLKCATRNLFGDQIWEKSAQGKQCAHEEMRTIVCKLVNKLICVRRVFYGTMFPTGAFAGTHYTYILATVVARLDRKLIMQICIN